MKKYKKLFIGMFILVSIFFIYIFFELRIIDKPYKWILSNVTKDINTTYDNDKDIINYQCESMKIQLEHIKEDSPNLNMWIVTIKINNPWQLKSAFAGGKFSQHIKERTSVIAKENNAVLAIDGAAVGFNDNGVVIRNNETYRISALDSPALIIDGNGDFKIYETNEETLREIPYLNVMHTLDFGPVLINNNKISEDYGHWYKDDKDPRTVIGQKGPLEYVILVADGRSKNSEGISLYDAAVELYNRGCYIGYNLDGGGSTTLYFNGEVLNNPSDIIGERRISDILYFSNK